MAKKKLRFAEPSEIIAAINDGATVENGVLKGTSLKITAKRAAQVVDVLKTVGHKSMVKKAEKWIESQSLQTGQGRRPPQENSARKYKISSAGTITMKIDEYLGVQSGNHVWAHFADGFITIQKTHDKAYEVR